jgi:hypothetical protein
MIAAYIVGAVIVLGYTVSLWVRLRRERNRRSVTDEVRT